MSQFFFNDNPYKFNYGVFFFIETNRFSLSRMFATPNYLIYERIVGTKVADNIIAESIGNFFSFKEKKMLKYYKPEIYSIIPFFPISVFNFFKKIIVPLFFTLVFLIFSLNFFYINFIHQLAI